MRRLLLAAAFGLAGAPALAAGPPCVEFETQLGATLARSPSSIEVNNLLFEASRKGCVEALARLFAAGASRLARNREGDTALGLAARAGRDEIVAGLLDGASEAERRQIDFADAQGETALSEAAFAGDEAMGEALLAKGALPDAPDRFGKTPICYAAARGAVGLVAALIGAGVDANARYGGDLTALMWAAGHPDLTATERAVATVKLLISRGAQLDLADDRGRSALMIAAGLNRFETARALLDAGATKALRDKKGASAADLAATPEMRALVGE